MSEFVSEGIAFFPYVQHPSVSGSGDVLILQGTAGSASSGWGWGKSGETSQQPTTSS